MDIDSDADLDLVVGDEGGSMTFVENTGTVTAPIWGGPVHPNADLAKGSHSAPAFLDVDADGNLDILVGPGGGSMAYVRNTGTALSPTSELVTTKFPGVDIAEHATPAAPDLVIGDGDGGLNVHHYQRPGTSQGTETYAPGDLLQVERTVRLHSPAITLTTPVTDISVHGALDLMMSRNLDGQPIPGENYFMSSIRTPSGFPIQRGGRPVVSAGSHFLVKELRHLGAHAIEGDFISTGQVPADLPLGDYRPVIALGLADVPTRTDWLAANVTYHTFWPEIAPLPPVNVRQISNSAYKSPWDVSPHGSPVADSSPVVGRIVDSSCRGQDVDSAYAAQNGDSAHTAADGASSHNWDAGALSRRHIWWLLMDDFVHGIRGTGAREDRDVLGLASQIAFQCAPYTVPPVDVRKRPAYHLPAGAFPADDFLHRPAHAHAAADPLRSAGLRAPRRGSGARWNGAGPEQRSLRPIVQPDQNDTGRTRCQYRHGPAGRRLLAEGGLRPVPGHVRPVWPSRDHDDRRRQRHLAKQHSRRRHLRRVGRPPAGRGHRGVGWHPTGGGRCLQPDDPVLPARPRRRVAHRHPLSRF